MDTQEQHATAWRLAEESDVLDFEAALQIVRYRPEKAEKILREREEWRQLMDELDRAHERLRQSALEFR
ncbi:MAG TPA: hypothetical protein VNC15_02340 [Solirubrobacterales bacterium]|jgi:hypothetical protein|nr:hypothetical protein [Solirubrobacterales bacterium]